MDHVKKKINHDDCRVVLLVFRLFHKHQKLVRKIFFFNLNFCFWQKNITINQLLHSHRLQQTFKLRNQRCKLNE